MDESEALRVREELEERYGVAKHKKTKRPEFFVMMAMDVHKPSTAVAWLKLEKGGLSDLSPLGAVRRWFEFVGMEDCTRRIFAPNAQAVGQSFGKGKIQSYEARLINFITHHKANLLLLGGPEGDWFRNVLNGSPEMERFQKRKRMEIRMEEWPVASRVSSDLMMRCKLYCAPLMRSLLDLVDSDDWEEL